MVDGYGLTPPIARRVHERGADLLITVDNGIASVEGVAAANALGLQSANGGALLSFGDNQVVENATDGAFTGTLTMR